MTIAKSINKTLDISVEDVRIDLTATIKSYDLTDTQFIFEIKSSNGMNINLTGSTAMYIVEYVHNSQTYAIQGNVDIIGTDTLSFNLPEDLKGYKGTVLIGIYVKLTDGTKIDIKDIAVRIEPSIMDKGIDFTAKTYFKDFESVKAEVVLEGEKVKTDINAVVSDVNSYSNTKKQAIDNIVSDVQSTGDTAKGEIKATLPTLQTQVSELDKQIKELSQTMINKYNLGSLHKGFSDPSTVISYANNNQNYNVKIQCPSGYMYVSGFLGRYGDLKNKKLELYILNNRDAFDIDCYLSKGVDWGTNTYAKFINISVNSGLNKITIDIPKIINNDFNYTDENGLFIGFRKNKVSQINLDFTFFICEIGAETVSFDNKALNKADYAISAEVADIANDSGGKLDDRLLSLESGQLKKNKLTLAGFSGAKQHDDIYFEYSKINNNYSLKFNKTNGYIFVYGFLGKYGDFKTKTIVLYLNSNKNVQLNAYLSKGTDWNPANHAKFVNVNVKRGANLIEINISDLINGDSNYADSDGLFFGIRDQINNNVDVEITFYLTEKLLNENSNAVIYADFALNAAGDLENRLTNLENLANQKSKYITCWGDSLTAMGGWTTELANLSGLTVYNGGTGGENVKTIVARQGADAMIVNNLTIPADTSPILIATRNQLISTILGNKVGPLLQGGAHVNPCYIGDIKGTLRWTGSSYADTNGTWTFTRESAGNEVAINRPTAIRTDFDINRNAPHLMVIFIGQNGGYDNVDDLIHWHKLMINHANADNVLILGLSSGTKEERKEYESKMKLEFGRYFISLREYLATPIYNEDTIISCYGLEDAGLTPTQNDLTAIASGKVPPQLLIDSVHYTDATRKVIGRLIYKRAKELNIF